MCVCVPFVYVSCSPLTYPRTHSISQSNRLNISITFRLFLGSEPFSSTHAYSKSIFSQNFNGIYLINLNCEFCTTTPKWIRRSQRHSWRCVLNENVSLLIWSKRAYFLSILTDSNLNLQPFHFIYLYYKYMIFQAIKLTKQLGICAAAAVYWFIIINCWHAYDAN